ncbi:heavy metal translocatin [Aureobasidium subglaciale]|nr:heavy metal translocatin [Aureobasidium subglaciale]
MANKKHSVTIRHAASISSNTVASSLEKAGFEVYSVVQANREPTFTPWQFVDTGIHEDWGLEQAVQRWKTAGKDKDAEVEHQRKRKRHVEQCAQCLRELSRSGSLDALMEKAQSFAAAPDIEKGVYVSTEDESSENATEKLASVGSATPELFRATFSIEGMTCSACVTNVSQAVSQHPFIRDVNINLLSNSATVTFSGRDNEKLISESIEDAGYDVALSAKEDISVKHNTKEDAWRAILSITGMTCAACVRALTTGLEQPNWIERAQVTLLSNSAIVTFKGAKDKVNDVIELIEDLGFDASVEDIHSTHEEQGSTLKRHVVLQMAGMYCHHCPARIVQALFDHFGNEVTIEEECSTTRPLLKLSYQSRPPNLTLRHVMKVINEVDAEVQAAIFNPPTIEQRSREIHAAESRKILLRFALSLVTAIPTFIIGIVYMTLVDHENAGRKYLMQQIWAGTVSRAEWALFILGTIIYFFAADIFHIRSLQGIYLMWKQSSKTPLSHRLFRFGNMNMLISLGTSIAYFASIAALAVNATSGEAMGAGQAYYFDSVVFLTLFLLGGRGLEAWSKAKTGDAVAALGSLRPDTALLVTTSPDNDSTILDNTATELLEVGDVVRVLHGSSPPFDGIILDGETKFDEASLTGEARLVPKHTGDDVFSGTINNGSPVDIRLTSISNTSMLDQIIKVVREGQTKRAPVERIADLITSRFVPFIILIGISTWLVWLSLGLSSSLPPSYLDSTIGGWPFWSLQFSIAVFVVACPCGIGLAAPTALFVGGGLAAKYGILVKGGGEAFQEASMLDCVVFDKTGTLTQGTAPAVTDYKVFGDGDEGKALAMARILEQNSNHPVARAVVEFCKAKSLENDGMQVIDVEEVPGKGLKGTFRVNAETKITAIIGNEALMTEHGIYINPQNSNLVESWKQQGKSIAILSISSSSSTTFTLAAAFAIAGPLRPEAATVVKWLQKQGLEVFMISGDNAITANSVGAAVGIPASNIMAGVLPEQKADKIKYLQQTLSPRRSRGVLGLLGSRKQRSVVGMIGDGINDAPALATADVSVAIGSGSDVALSAASFVLVTSDLQALVRLLELSRVVFRRVMLNFAWALVYNLIALPVAAGALYAITSGEKHVRLDPVWASLAMALSSVSVVSSSLLLRTRIPLLGFRASKAV